MLPELYSSLPIPLDAVMTLAQTTRELWLKCRRNSLPLDRADAALTEKSAVNLASAKLLTSDLEIVSPREFVLQRGYFVARVLSVHERTLVLLLPDMSTYRVRRGIIERGESSTFFVSTYKSAKPGHYLFRRSSDGLTIKRVCAIDADYLI